MGLDYLHRVCGILHTDLKPENVLVKLTQEQINEIISKGSLLGRGDAIPATPVKTISHTPVMELTKQISGPDPEEVKKQKKRDKKKEYRKRKADIAKAATQALSELAAQTGEQPPPTAEKKKRKRRNRKKKTQAPEETK